ncbi:MAG: hypothetical protein AAF471_08130, partial [Myxococcota bacterium]
TRPDGGGARGGEGRKSAVHFVDAKRWRGGKGRRGQRFATEGVFIPPQARSLRLRRQLRDGRGG